MECMSVAHTFATITCLHFCKFERQPTFISHPTITPAFETTANTIFASILHTSVYFIFCNRHLVLCLHYMRSCHIHGYVRRHPDGLATSFHPKCSMISFAQCWAGLLYKWNFESTFVKVHTHTHLWQTDGGRESEQLSDEHCEMCFYNQCRIYIFYK